MPHYNNSHLKVLKPFDDDTRDSHSAYGFVFSDDIQDWIMPMKRKSYYKKIKKRKYDKKVKLE